MAQHGRRPVYEPDALAFEKASSDSEDEFGRRVRMHAQGWLHLLSGRMLQRADPSISPSSCRTACSATQAASST